MKNTLRKLIYAIPMFFLLTACHFDDLYYSQGEYCPIRLNIDWSKTNLRLNGATAYIFDKDGSLFSELPPSSNPYSVEMLLPVGKYYIGVHSNTNIEMPNINLTGTAHADDFMATIVPISSNRAMYNELDNMGLAHLFQFEVSSMMLQYYPYKPGTEPTDYKEVTIEANEFIKHIDIVVHIKGISFAKGAPESELSGLSRGYYLMKQEPSDETTTCQFFINKRKNSSDASNSAIISRKIESFGWNMDDETKKMLKIKFKLVNDKEHYLEFDVTDKIQEIDERNYKIEVECELPDTPSLGGGDDGAFDTTVGEWEDIEVDVPMR